MWTIEYTEQAIKQLGKLDKQQCRIIINWLDKRAATDADPKLFAEQLTGNMSEYCRFRVGDYRIIWKLKDDIVTILVLRIAHRREVYNSNVG